MLYLYYAILGAVFFATLAMCVDKGVWSNTLTIFNILFSGLIAFAFYSPLAKMASENGLEEFTYLLDFLAIWLLYVVAFIVLHRVLSAALSKTRMRFKYPIDTIGGPATAALAGWLMTCLVAATLHTAPFDRDAFGGAFNHGSGASTLTNPDLAWLSIAEKMLSNDHLGAGDREFTARRFVSDFGNQREALEKSEGLKVNR